ncbi:MAG: large conductance mechanosensitive channel protein MscL [Oscillospiraceae bacterium]|nr:large conductance mechanosensitive channel protein MscL [Oscillospiraceae bacterium]
MKKFLKDFKEVAMRGNVLDLAVGVVIGAAFKSIVDSLVNDILSPLIGLLFRDNFSNLAITVGTVSIHYGAFISAVVNFIIVALALFLVIKTANAAASFHKKPAAAAAAAPTTKICPNCQSEIPLTASRCPHCTSQLEEKYALKKIGCPRAADFFVVLIPRQARPFPWRA